MYLKSFKLFFLLLFVFDVHATGSVGEDDLRSGDVILMSIDCYLCRAIEVETGSEYSHVGIVLGKKDGVVWVADASSKGVIAVPFEEFVSEEDARHALIVRHRQFEKNPFPNGILFELFYHEFNGLEYNMSYRWKQTDALGRPSYYCSQFVAAILNFFLDEEIKPAPTSYRKQFELWKKIFQGNVPEGELGISPSYFEKSDSFTRVGTISNVGALRNAATVNNVRPVNGVSIDNVDIKGDKASKCADAFSQFLPVAI